MENFAGVEQTPEVKAKASGGLSDEELISIIAGSPTRQVYTNLFTQGFVEFQRAGGTDVNQFARLEETIFQQFAWGNPTAARNQLKVGYGSPEQGILGIADRQSGFLLYDANGDPLRSFAGTRVRDTGYVGAGQPDWALINLASIEDPGLRDFLNELRLAVGDPLRTIGAAAKVYMDNMPLINSTIEQGLTEEVIEKFEDMIDVFIGFVAGHALSSFLIASANPALAAIGAALKALLVAAGYIMDIDFAAGALHRLLEAGYHFSRVVKKPDGSFTELAKFHLEEGATPIRSMIAEIVSMWLASRVGESIGESLHKKEIESIDCTHCRFGRRERRARARIKEASELGNFGWTPAEIEGARRQIRERQPATNPQEVKHKSGGASHGVPADTMIKTINDPQVILLAANGNWVFYRTGTIVITEAGDVDAVQTAFGRGAKLPERHVDLFNNTSTREGRPGWTANGRPATPSRRSISTASKVRTGAIRHSPLCGSSPAHHRIPHALAPPRHLRPPRPAETQLAGKASSAPARSRLPCCPHGGFARSVNAKAGSSLPVLGHQDRDVECREDADWVAVGRIDNDQVVNAVPCHQLRGAVQRRVRGDRDERLGRRSDARCHPFVLVSDGCRYDIQRSYDTDRPPRVVDYRDRVDAVLGHDACNLNEWRGGRAGQHAGMHTIAHQEVL